MGSVRRNAPGSAKRVIGYGLSVILAASSSGCAALGFRGTDYPFLGSLWGHSKATEVYPGGDLYAQQMNEAKAKAAAREATSQGKPALSPKDSPKDTKKDSEKSDDPNLPPALEPKSDDAPKLEKPDTEKSAAKNRSDTNTIRVTLGRPEALPTVSKGKRDVSTSRDLMASTAGTPKWKKDTRQAEPDELSSPRSLGRSVPRSDSERTSTPARTKTRAAVSVDDSAEPASRSSNEDKTRELLTQAQSKLKTLSSYQVAMTRVERVGGQLQPEESVILSINQSPKAVHLKWEDGPSKGREVLYSTKLDDRVIHVNMAGAAIPLPRMSIAVDSPLIMRNSRHSIKEAGFDTILANMANATTHMAKAETEGGRVRYEGLVQRQGIERKCHRFVRVTPSGEQWEVLLDSKTLLPRSVIAKDRQGELLERYTYRDLKENPPELASASAFDPDARWGKSKGLLSRLAGAAVGANAAAAGDSSQSTTR